MSVMYIKRGQIYSVSVKNIITEFWIFFLLHVSFDEIMGIIFLLFLTHFPCEDCLNELSIKEETCFFL